VVLLGFAPVAEAPIAPLRARSPRDVIFGHICLLSRSVSLDAEATGETSDSFSTADLASVFLDGRQIRQIKG
jgi:hypothetical protein